MAFNEKDFRIRTAIAYYLETPEEEVDWSEIDFIQASNEITRWDNTQKLEPSTQHLMDIWFPWYYKDRQGSALKEQFEDWIETGGVGFQTDVPDGSGGYIKVDCRKMTYKDDLQNFEKLLYYLTETSQPGSYIKDYYGNMQAVTLAQLKTIVTELTGYGLGLYQLKWQRESELAAIVKEETETIEEYVTRIEAVNFPE